MIPADIDLEDLVSQLREDGVAVTGISRSRPDLEEGLGEVLAEADAGGFGSAGVVLLDRTPAQPADQRDIAQDLLNLTDLETVIVRSPGSGAIVSDIHSRADIEAAQWHFLGNGDYVAATRDLVNRMMETPEPQWLLLSLLALLLLAGVAAMTWLSLRTGWKMGA